MEKWNGAEAELRPMIMISAIGDNATADGRCLDWWFCLICELLIRFAVRIVAGVSNGICSAFGCGWPHLPKVKRTIALQ